MLAAILHRSIYADWGLSDPSIAFMSCDDSTSTWFRPAVLKMGGALGGYGDRIKQLYDVLADNEYRAVPWRDDHPWPYDVGNSSDTSDA